MVDERDDLQVLDRALTSMRRFLQAPRTVPDGAEQIELSTLLILDALDGAPAAVTIGQIAERLQVTHSTASRLVQRAVAVGMITRGHGDDSRSAALHPTAAGTALTARAKAFRYDVLRQRLRGWSAEEIGSFARALARFATSVTTSARPVQ